MHELFGARKNEAMRRLPCRATSYIRIKTASIGYNQWSWSSERRQWDICKTCLARKGNSGPVQTLGHPVDLGHAANASEREHEDNDLIVWNGCFFQPSHLIGGRGDHALQSLDLLQPWTRGHFVVRSHSMFFVANRYLDPDHTESQDSRHMFHGHRKITKTRSRLNRQGGWWRRCVAASTELLENLQISAKYWSIGYLGKISGLPSPREGRRKRQVARLQYVQKRVPKYVMGL